MHTKEVWPRIIASLEQAAPYYDQVNEWISLGRAERARQIAIERAELTGNMRILDSGIGPGNIALAVLAKTKPSLLVGLDVSIKLLRLASQKGRHAENSNLQLIRAVFEHLPFRDSTFDRVVTAYALRDARDISMALSEYGRVCHRDGRLVIVDLGKPEGLLKRVSVTLYIHFLMPAIAKLAILRKLRGNPWRMIVPTFDCLPTNRQLVDLAKQRFREVSLEEHSVGGIVIVTAQNPSVETHILQRKNDRRGYRRGLGARRELAYGP